MASFEQGMFYIGRAASQFQFIEECLKMYLCECFDIVRKNVQGKIAFEYTDKDVRNKSLGPLIVMFKKYSTNKQLVERLEKIREDRNYIAHEAYVLVGNPTDESVEEDEFLRIQNIAESAHEIAMILFSRPFGVTHEKFVKCTSPMSEFGRNVRLSPCEFRPER